MAIIVENKTIRIEHLALGVPQTNTYIVVCQKTMASVLIDAPAEAETILKSLAGTYPAYILLTHNDPDHTGALFQIHSRLVAPVAIHSLHIQNPPINSEIPLENGNTLCFGELQLKVLHTPGHTPGSSCFLVGNHLFSGDTLFNGGPGPTQTPADFKRIIASLTARIFVLPDDTQVYPGHGLLTSVRKEKEEYQTFSSRPHTPELCGDVIWLKS